MRKKPCEWVIRRGVSILAHFKGLVAHRSTTHFLSYWVFVELELNFSSFFPIFDLSAIHE